MAVMWPRQLPHEVVRNDLRAAERKVYDRLATQLGPEWTVFYSRPWLGLTPSGAEIDGEADFVVAAPHSGFLTLEVKGGAISYDPASEQWLSRDRHGLRHKIKNPVEQARSSKHELLRKLREVSGMENHFVRVRHAVIFPDSANPGRDLGPDMPLSLFCFRDEFERGLGAWVRERMGEPAGREQPLGAAGIRALENLLAHPFQLRVPLGHTVREDDDALRELTPTQFRILTAIEGLPRAAVSGGAGTGKTILAIEKARRCAESGRRTLLTCFNRPLASYLAARTRGIPGLEVATFQAACRRALEAAGLPLPPDPANYPDLVAEAVRRRPDLRFDAIVVDEGQDMREHWWAALDDLRATSEAVLFVFLDSNQRVYPNAATLPRDVQLVPIRLTANLRNTKNIHDVCQRHYDGPTMVAGGPDGQPVEWIVADARSRARELEGLVTRYLADKVSPGDIALIGGRAPWSPGTRLVGQPTVDSESVDDRSIVCDTIRRFKGLERAVVIVIVDEVMAGERELAYVALSRGRALLAVIGDAGAVSRLRGV
jgi:hypothetical protein